MEKTALQVFSVSLLPYNLKFVGTKKYWLVATALEGFMCHPRISVAASLFWVGVIDTVICLLTTLISWQISNFLKFSLFYLFLGQMYSVMIWILEYRYVPKFIVFQRTYMLRLPVHIGSNYCLRCSTFRLF